MLSKDGGKLSLAQVINAREQGLLPNFHFFIMVWGGTDQRKHDWYEEKGVEQTEYNNRDPQLCEDIEKVALCVNTHDNNSDESDDGTMQYT